VEYSDGVFERKPPGCNQGIGQQPKKVTMNNSDDSILVSFSHIKNLSLALDQTRAALYRVASGYVDTARYLDEAIALLKGSGEVLRVSKNCSDGNSKDK